MAIDWQVTAKAIYCDAVDDDVVITVYRDGKTRCTGYQKYVEHGNNDSNAVLKKKSRVLNRNLKCEGPADFRVTGYRDAIIAPNKT
jgi:hypothetical protein